MKSSKKSKPIKTGTTFTLVATAPVIEVARMWGLVEFARRGVLQNRHFEVDTAWKVVEQSNAKAVIQISDAHTHKAIAKVVIVNPKFAGPP